MDTQPIDKKRILYIGGFELPDKNAAAQRVIGIAKSLRDSGYKVRFVNALKEYSGEPHKTEYFGFSTFEYKREGDKDYLPEVLSEHEKKDNQRSKADLYNYRPCYCLPEFSF